MIHGIPQLEAKLKAYQAAVEAASPEAVAAGGQIVANAMRSRAPRDTGRLASSIRTDVSSLGDGAVAHTGAEVPYDRFVQRGTIYMSAQPYGEDAADSVAASVVAAMAAVYKAALP